VRKLCKGCEASSFGIDENDLHLAQMIVHRQGGNHSACQNRLARSGCPGYEDMRHIWAGKPHNDWDSLFVHSQSRAQGWDGPQPTAKGQELYVGRVVSGNLYV